MTCRSTMRRARATQWNAICYWKPLGAAPHLRAAKVSSYSIHTSAQKPDTPQREQCHNGDDHGHELYTSLSALHSLHTQNRDASSGSWRAERDSANSESPASPVSSVWSSSDSDSDEEEGHNSTAMVVRRHGSSTAAVARALMRVRFLQGERQSLQQRLQVRYAAGMTAWSRSPSFSKSEVLTQQSSRDLTLTGSRCVTPPAQTRAKGRDRGHGGLVTYSGRHFKNVLTRNLHVQEVEEDKLALAQKQRDLLERLESVAAENLALQSQMDTQVWR